MTEPKLLTAISMEDILNAIHEIDKNGIRAGRHSSGYDLVHEGRTYPPKLVLSIAYKYATGKELDSSQFEGGKGTPAYKRLKELGFLVLPKSDPLKALIEHYKAYISKSKMKDEVYKWKLLAEFRGRPDLNAADFAQELRSIKFQNLMYQMAFAVTRHIAKDKPEEYRKLFVALFNEETTLEARIKSFAENSLSLYRSLGETAGHHQDERTIATYLTFYNPDKYTFYKSTFYKPFCELMGEKPAGKNKKYSHYLHLLNQFIDLYIKPDQALIDDVKSYIPEYYDGSNHLLLAQDILFTMLDRARNDSDCNYWIFQGNPKIYNIVASLNDNALKSWSVKSHKEAIKPGDKVILWVTGNETGCYGLAEVKSEVIEAKDDEAELSYYLTPVKNEVSTRTKIEVTHNFANHPILKNEIESLPGFEDFKGGNQGTNFTANKEQYERLLRLRSDKKPIDRFKNNENMKLPVNQILYGPPGTGKTYQLKRQLFSEFTTQESNLSKEQYIEQQVQELTWWQVIALALLDRNNSKVIDVENNRWVKAKSALSESKNVRATIWGTLQMHTINESKTVAYSQRQAPLIFDKNSDKSWNLLEQEALDLVPELFSLKAEIDNFRPNPDKEIKRYEFITFHQNYSYEDFIEGIKPFMGEDTDGEILYEIKDGIFKKLCKRAENDSEHLYAIFIDEINRGNVSAIFGELITLIEEDKRKGAENQLTVKLPYSKSDFSVPSNLHIIGTMNTADRSVEALDTALRRRFNFVEMLPNPELLKDIKIEGIELQKLLEVMNERIEVLVDRDHTVGHAFFINDKSLDDLRNTFANKIIPLLQEYFYGDYGKMEMVIGSNFFVKKEVSKVKFAVKTDDFDAEGVVYHIKNLMDKEIMSDNEFADSLKQLIAGQA